MEGGREERREKGDERNENADPALLRRPPQNYSSPSCNRTLIDERRSLKSSAMVGSCSEFFLSLVVSAQLNLTSLTFLSPSLTRSFARTAQKGPTRSSCPTRDCAPTVRTSVVAWPGRCINMVSWERLVGRSRRCMLFSSFFSLSLSPPRERELTRDTQHG